MLRDLPKKGMKALIRGYSFVISPLLGQNCRYHPTCSAYALEAIDLHGSVKGGYLAARRILACHPWSRRPFIDPVPGAVDRGDIIGYKRAEPKGKE